MEEESVVMTVYGVRVTAKQRDAGLAVMNGDFTMNDVAAALVRAGVPHFTGEGYRREYCANRAADRLLQSERKAGRIKAITNRKWRRS